MGIAQTSMFRGAFPKVSIDYSTHCIMELLQVRSTRAREFRGDYLGGFAKIRHPHSAKFGRRVTES